MKSYFTTGQFARLANVTERTIRYYDKQGLLKPSFIMENGYRKYSEDDFIRLQRIISLKQLGFSLNEIKMMDIDTNHTAMEESLQLQIDLLDKKIRHAQLLKDSLVQTKQLLRQGSFTWDKMVSVLQLNTEEEKIIEHYRDERHLSIRISLHERFSQNSQGWFNWLYQQIDFTEAHRILELGCGSGELWKQQPLNMRNKEIFLSDISQGMLESTRKELGEAFNYMQIDANSIPFKQEYFDAMIANHMLFYLNDVTAGLKEIHRVLKKGGHFYCSTYSKQHMQEINQLVKEFDEQITLSDRSLPQIFGLENGGEILKQYFSKVEKRLYKDALSVDDAQALFSYIMSCHGNQMDMLSERMEEFKSFIEAKIEQEGAIYITKEAGVFVCEK